MKRNETSTTNPLNKSLSEQLRICRKNAGLSMREVARRVKKTPATICKWENGETTPYGDTLLELCKVYNVDITFFYGVATPQEIRITPSETKLIQLYRNSTKNAQLTIRTILEKCQKEK